MPNTPPPAASPNQLLQQMIMGFRLTQLLHVAAKLDIADLLADHPQSARDLAGICECNADALYRLLRALAQAGVLIELPQQRFQLAPMGELLRSEVDGSLHGMALLYGEPWLWNAYGQLLHSVRTGEPAFDHAHGARFFEYLETHEDAAKTFHDAMSAFSEQEIAALIGAYDFSRERRLVDVGGGHGRLLSALLRRHPRLFGTLYDLPSVVDGARELHESELAARSATVGGDFFEHVPSGGDLYLLKSVIHDWDDDRASRILKNCRAAMHDDSRLLVVERVVGDRSEPSEAKLFDINMLAVLGGRERTQLEHQVLLDSAGFRLTRLIATSSPLTILEAMPHP